MQPKDDGGPQPLYVRDAQSFGTMTDAFTYTGIDVDNAQALFSNVANRGGDAFANASAASDYAKSFAQTIQALNSLQRGLADFATLVNAAGNAYFRVDRQIATGGV